MGVDLDGLAGSGPSGGITKTDVEAAAARAAAARQAPAVAATLAATAAERAPVPGAGKAPAIERAAARAGGFRRALAAAMERSNREIPHYYLSTEVDLLRARTWLELANQERKIAERILPAVLLLKAVALAGRDVPE